MVLFCEAAPDFEGVFAAQGVRLVCRIASVPAFGYELQESLPPPHVPATSGHVVSLLLLLRGIASAVSPLARFIISSVWTCELFVWALN
jgi:hypothetical protein